MNYSFLARCSLGCVSLTGGCCAVAAPIAMSVGQVGEKVTTSTDSSVTLAGSDGEKVTEDGIEAEILSYDEVWQKIDSQYKAKLGSEASTAGWTKKLQQILEVSDTSTKTWQIEEQSWDSCVGEEEQSSDFYGYLEIKKDEKSYKLQLNSTTTERELKLQIVKQAENVIQYYKEDNWTAAENTKWDNLTICKAVDKRQYWTPIAQLSLLEKNRLSS
ncbi:hypothetical protein [Candidatus Mycoplasma haematominutum]|uniref:Lipoprotein n=1 Tax=Candidatus Mycoplasma haematominutum 'Birmingham 1' TaxID=1116213 RepID=G8C3U5_9MOLU|nr:hypothetical protein [Candidatus Mycoplasma haematominutum]CCE66993.1 hypothetical protein MHM_04750 [Candidatus Mycoplasma haematominutum 'Birmingham 1']